MPNIAIFPSFITREQKIREQLAERTGFTIIDDQHILKETGRRFSLSINKLEKAIYQKTSVFNKFTLEKERCIAAVKSVIADRLTQPQNLYYGFLTSLIPSRVTHVLKVLLVESKATRIALSVQNGMTTREAEKFFKQHDTQSLHWTDFLYSLEPWNKKLHDVILPVDSMATVDIVQYISEQCAQGAVLETEDSRQAVADLALASNIELALLDKGHKLDTEIIGDTITLKVHKSVFSFDALSRELQNIVSPLAGARKIEVKMGEDYSDSIYRDQEFKLPPKVLLVDDEKDFVLTLSERLMSRNVGSYAVYDGQEALTFLEDDKPDVMVLDLKMPGVSGLEVLKQTKKENPDIEIIILTGHGTEEDKRSCLALGAFAYLQKPTDIQTLSAKIHEAHTHVLAKEPDRV